LDLKRCRGCTGGLPPYYTGGLPPYYTGWLAAVTHSRPRLRHIIDFALANR
jgi:hypothetical protein